jgi:hypothetical protein
VAVDAVTAEVTGALGEAGIPVVLLKGPSIARWLYDDERVRGYSDSDLLVDPARVRDAEQVLSAIGFRRAWGPVAHPGMESPPAAPWHRGPFSVDLHEALPGALVPPQRAWGVLAGGLASMDVGGRAVTVLRPDARLVHVVLHAAHHGPRVAQPIDDLRAAAARLDVVDWVAALDVAERIGATAAFANGLSMLPETRALGRRLRIGVRPSREWVLATSEGAHLAVGLDRLLRTRGPCAKATLVRHELFPSRDFMRWRHPLARRSSRGLVAAYAWRVVDLAVRVPRAAWIWLGAGR